MYEEIDQVLPADQSNDWKKFFLTNNMGIKKTGQLFLQKAVEAHVYCVLGAQANTRWKIVGAGAKSLQTQEAFSKLAKKTVAQDDDSVLISNMRTAVKATNVVLNLAILPRMILIPSDFLILKKKIPGYNNTLTMATKSMSFGKNEKINFSETEGTEQTEGAEDTEDMKETEVAEDTKETEGAEDTKETEEAEDTEETKGAEVQTKGAEVQDETKGAEVQPGLGYVVGKNNKGLAAVFTVMSLVGALCFRFLAS